MSRVSIYAVPNEPRRCTVTAVCIYRPDGICDEPRVNKGNSDSACHKMNNRDLLVELHLPATDSRRSQP